jgi:hypothetical protein
VPADGPIKPEANPSFCDLPHFLPRHNFAASLAVARTRKALKCSAFQRKGDAIAGAIAFDNVD